MNESVNNETTPLTADTQTEASIAVTLSTPDKKLQLVPNWKKVLFTYSFWTNILSVILTLVEVILPFFGMLEPMLTPAVYGAAMFTLNVSAAVFRLIKQKKLWPSEDTSDGDK